MALADEIAVKLGIRTTEFKAALKDANVEIAKFKQAGTFGENEGLGATVSGIHHKMRALHQFLLAGGLLTIARELFVKGAEYAKTYSGAIDDDVEAMKRLQDATTGLSATVGKAVVGVAGFMEKVGLLAGALVYGEDAAAEAMQRMAVESKAAFDAARLKEYEAAMTSLDKQRRNNAFAELTDRQKTTVLIKEQFDLMGKQNGLEKESSEYIKLQQDIEQKGYEIEKLDMKERLENNKKLNDLVFGRVEGLEPKSVKTTEVKLKLEKQITAEIQAQNDAQKQQDELSAKGNLILQDTLIVNGKAYGPSRDPRLIETASEAELKDLVRKAKLEIASIKATEGTGPSALADAATGFIIQESVIARLQTDVQRAQYRLNTLSGIRNTVAQFGEQTARAKFGGDPLAFDSLLATATQQKTEQTKTNQQLEDLNSRLAAAGFTRR